MREILSTENPVYMGLISEQQNGQFRPVCKSCDFYKSIYHMRTANRGKSMEFLSLSEFMETLDVAAPACASPKE